MYIFIQLCFPGGSDSKESTFNAFNAVEWQLTPVFFPGKFHGQRSLVGYSLWGHKRLRPDLPTEQQQEKLSQKIWPIQNIGRSRPEKLVYANR